MASKAISTTLQIAGLLCWRRAFEIGSGVVIDHRSFHRKIDRTNWNRAKEGSKHAYSKTGRQRFNQSLSGLVASATGILEPGA